MQAPFSSSKQTDDTLTNDGMEELLKLSLWLLEKLAEESEF